MVEGFLEGKGCENQEAFAEEAGLGQSSLLGASTLPRVADFSSCSVALDKLLASL